MLSGDERYVLDQPSIGDACRSWAYPLHGITLPMDIERQSGFAVAASFLYPYEADLAKSFLDSHDVPAWIFDEHQIRQRWFLSAALGGVKICVGSKDLERAKLLLATDHSPSLEGIPEGDLEPHADEICRACGESAGHVISRSSKVSLRTWLGGLVSFVVMLVSALIPVPLRWVREEWECGSYGARWIQEGPR